jgi:hypothetical protein
MTRRLFAFPNKAFHQSCLKGGRLPNTFVRANILAEKAGRAAEEAKHLQGNSADRVGQQHSDEDADDEQRRGQRSFLGGSNVVQNQIGKAAGVVRRPPTTATRIVGVKMPIP